MADIVFQYRTKQGDTWDFIAKDIYGSEKLAHVIQEANPGYLHYITFPSGLLLTIPDLPPSMIATPTAPWKRMQLLKLPPAIGKYILAAGLWGGGKMHVDLPGRDAPEQHPTDSIFEGGRTQRQINAELRRDKVAADDPRLENDRKPTKHAASHFMSGDDRIRPEDLGALSAPPGDGKNYLATGGGWVEYDEPGQDELGTFNHALLTNRNAPNQHPQSAIQHLAEDLQSLRDDIDGLDAAVNGVADGLDNKITFGTAAMAVGSPLPTGTIYIQYET